MDSDQPVHAVPADAMRVQLCLRDEEANASRACVAGGSLTELPWRISVKSVQQDVQQQGRTTARMYDRRQRWLPAELVPTWHAPVVCI